MPYSRGDVVLVLYPNSDLVTAKKRPALVVQRDDLNSGLPQVIIAMLSSRTFRAGHPSRVLIEQGDSSFVQTGLLGDTVLMTDNLATVLESEIERQIGNWPKMAEADKASRYTMSL
jgi:mRNA interferase MazF